jgi:outer membrane immunogenic protein
MRISKVIVSAAVAISAIVGVGAASAADLLARTYTKAPAMVMDPSYNWTGFYIGADVGGAWARQSAGTVSPVAINQASTFGGMNSDGVVGGVYGGYNWAFAPAWVFGVEGDFSGIKSNASYFAANVQLNGLPATGGITASRSLNWLATARGRLGYSFTPDTLFYVTGGAAWADINYSGTDAFGGGCPPNCGTFSSRDTRTGYAVGGGVDWSPWRNNWIIRAEYLYYRFGGGSHNAIFVTGPASIATTYSFSDLEIHTARVGISYKFGGPVVAKY